MRGVNLPKKCINCGSNFIGEDHPREAYLFIRSQLDFDGDDEEGTRIEDQIYECSKCHVLFRARWKLSSFTMLKEMKNHVL